uniref:mucin-5AC-like n=1 Tax=Monopterus albus TaxID=43700 RepID=UPI0009B3BAA2
MRSTIQRICESRPDSIVSLPFVTADVSAIQTTSGFSFKAKIGINIFLNEDDSLEVELDDKFRNQASGLCGNFDGKPDDLFKDGVTLSPTEYGAFYQVNGPTESCEEPNQAPEQDCDDKPANGSEYAVLVDLVKCGISDQVTCLRAVTLALYDGSVVAQVQATGQIYMNGLPSQLPLFMPDLSAFKPSSFYTLMQTKVGIQVMIQMHPVMQVFISADPSLKGTATGLCGNFNDLMSDDFMASSGLVEGTPTAFANTWKARVPCEDVRAHFGNPCSQSITKESYAKYWCSQLGDPSGVFAPCHSVINPRTHMDSCKYDTCTCENSEDCMCASISSYVYACAAAGIQLSGWRDTICSKYSTSCAPGTVYDYDMTSCGRTCYSLSQPDYSCQDSFTPVDGCGCAEGTYMNEVGQCVPSEHCPCYDTGT